MDEKQQKIMKIWQDFIAKITGIMKRRQDVMREADEEYKQEEIQKIKKDIGI